MPPSTAQLDGAPQQGAVRPAENPPPSENRGRGPLRWRGLRHTTGIRNRVLAIALIPCLALLVTGVTTFVVLVNQAREAETWSEYLNRQVDPLMEFVIAVQNERTTSLMVLNGNPAAVADLPVRRGQTDAVLGVVGQLAPEMQALHPMAVAKSTPIFMELGPQTPVIRQGVDMRQISPAEVDDFYSRLVGVIAIGLEGLARYTPDSGVAAEEMAASDIMQMADIHARIAGLGSGASGEESLRPDEQRTVTELVGAYRNQLNALASRFTESEQQRFQELTQSVDWRTATHGEDELGVQGVLPMPFSVWVAAEQAVTAELIGLVHDHMSYANTLAQDAAEESFERSVWVGVGVAAITLLALALAVWQANLLIRRLRVLRTGSLQLANETLPSVLERLHEGEAVDIEAETRVLDRRDDEIGEVAEAFANAQRSAMKAAAAEARTRSGFNKVFLDIAYRSQLVVRKQMEVLDLAESKQEDPEHLQLLFQLDHLATRARRNAENLLILGGGQPGRRWRKSVSLEELVRSAVSETEDLTRVGAIRLPEVQVVGKAVADLIHLFAELIENATNYSPPQSVVSVDGNLVGRGVVVEVVDQGLGIREEERERLNELLSNPPDFQEMALAGQRNLGLFVVSQLAERHNIAVTLHDSAYGGVKAIVLIPTELMGRRGDDDAEIPEAEQTGRHRTKDIVRTPAAGRPVSTPEGDRTMQLPPWPGDPIDDPFASAPAPAPAPTPPPPPAPAPAPAPRPVTGTMPSAPTGGGTNWHGGTSSSNGFGTRPPSRNRAPLPNRRRQTHLVPELRIDNEQNIEEPADYTPPPRPATDIRNSMASFQRGTQQAREFGTDENY